MARMVRKQVCIEPEQEEFLKRRAKELGVTEAELIRRGIDETSRVPFTPFPDRRAWEEAKAFIVHRMSVVVPQTGREWTREDLYDEQLKSFSD